MRTAIFIAVGLVLGLSVTVADAVVIKDASFFDSIPHTLIDFETNGAGDEVTLGESEIQEMYTDEYSSQGVLFDTPLFWANDGDPNADIAQSIGGSLDILICLSSSYESFEMTFTNPVKAFGFWVMELGNIPTEPVFTAKNSLGEELETVTFEGDLIDGSINAYYDPNNIIDYGFMGIYSSDEDIASVTITPGTNANFDNLFFSDVPEPASMTLLAVGGLALLRRKKLL